MPEPSQPIGTAAAGPARAAAAGPRAGFPQLLAMGIGGMLVSFGESMADDANRAALAFRAALGAASWPGVEETAASLASVYLRFDPSVVGHDDLRGRLATLIASRDWYGADLPVGRRRWTVPAVFGGALAPQLDEAAALAGLSPESAVDQLCARPVRVLAIGFAPGQPYLGTLPEAWDIPRQAALTANVPVGALVVAIRQLVLFSAATPTGWRHVGQTAFRAFRPEAAVPFALSAGDEIRFRAVGEGELAAIRAADRSGDGGARVEVLA